MYTQNIFNKIITFYVKMSFVQMSLGLVDYEGCMYSK